MTQVSKRRPRSPEEAAGCCRPIDAQLDVDLFRALSDPTRLSLLSCLAKCGRPCSVTEVAACCAVDLSVVSRHLKMLLDADVLASVKVGRTVSYAVRFHAVAHRLRALADAIGACEPAAAATARRTEFDGECCATG